MYNFFYLKLALQNIKKNRRFYFPYLLTGLLTVCMFYNMVFITYSDDISKMPGAGDLQFVLYMGTIVVGFFSVIFLLYTNSFLMKRRHNEIGLYNILGMEKKHIGKVMLWETAFTCLVTVIGGLAIGIMVSKLMMLLVFKLLFFQVHFGFAVSIDAVIITAVLFVCIYFFALVCNLVKVRLSKPIELLRGSNVGEREPKTKWLIAVIGILTLGSGYTIAIIVESPLQAILLFFLAVMLVIVGTYCLFSAGSIALLKLLKKNKNFYYKTSNFSAVSGMIYRMKQNAVGLANICILSTMVLVMLSTTVCMYIGSEDAINSRYPTDFSFSGDYELVGEYIEKNIEEAERAVEKTGINIKDFFEYTSISFAVNYNEGEQKFEFTDDSMANNEFAYLEVITAEEYGKITGKSISLKEDEVVLYGSHSKECVNDVKIGDLQFKTVKSDGEFSLYSSYLSHVFPTTYIIVSDNEVLYRVYEIQKIAYNDIYRNKITWHMMLNTDGTDEQKISCYEEMILYDVYGECKQVGKYSFYSLYGSLLFLGIFLGTLFLMATVLIIYYKQISEGYDDRERYDIMQRVGMSKEEIRRTISRQILIVFFMPLVAAVIHLIFAFKMITKLMLVLNLTNVGLFAICTLATIIVFAVVYAIVYMLTAREYYRIVK